MMKAYAEEADGGGDRECPFDPKDPGYVVFMRKPGFRNVFGGPRPSDYLLEDGFLELEADGLLRREVFRDKKGQTLTRYRLL